MRPYRLIEQTLDDDDEYPRVVPIGAAGRARPTAFGAGMRPEPWTPRDTTLPTASRRSDPSPPPARHGLTSAQRWMIAGFAIICIGMILGMALVRVWDDASRAVAALPPEGTRTATRQSTPAPPPPAGAPVASAEGSAAETGGAVTTEIRVLQPNYTVAPGDTLGSIARRHGTSVEALASINNLENRNSLGIGQKLIIP